MTAPHAQEPPAGPPPSLALVVPVRDDPDGAARVLADAARLGLFDQVVVVDDASDPALGDLPDPGCPVVRLRLDVQGGAGRARNVGLTAVTTSHVLWFDSDDRLLPGLAGLVAEVLGDADHATADFCVFRHVDSREEARGLPGPLPADQALWDEIGLAGEDGAPVALDAPAARRLVRISAYPWNKIYRTAFLREQGIRCTEIPVHNDVELHWTGFFAARRILASPRLGARHVVAEGGARLTNRTGLERFAVFEALSPLIDRVARDGSARGYLVPLVTFHLDLLWWIRGTLAPELRAPFARKAAHFLRTALPPALVRLLALEEVDTARRLIQRIRAWESAATGEES